MKKKTKVSKAKKSEPVLEEQEDRQDTEEERSSEQDPQVLVNSLAHPGQLGYQILVKFQELNQLLQEQNQLMRERNEILREDEEEDFEEEEDDSDEE